MPYTRTQWVNKQTRLNADNLNNLEGQYDAALRDTKFRDIIRTPIRAGDVALTTRNSSGLSRSGSVLSATVPGTEGRWWVPLWNANAFRASGTILVSKNTAGSTSMFGLSASTPATDPGTAADWVGAAYVQGVGIVLRRRLAPGADSVLIPDANLVDGQKVSVGLTFDALLHTTGVPGEFLVQATIFAADGSLTATGQFFSNLNYYTATGAFVARTNVSNGLESVQVTQALGGEVAAATALVQSAYYSGKPSERMSLRIPARPNGKLVIAVHGRGDGAYSQFTAAQYEPTWRLLLAAGYTIAMPDMGGDLWGTQAAQDYLTRVRDVVCAALNLDPRVFLWGGSMGGGAALTAIARDTFGSDGVRAAYLAQPVCDVAAVYADNPAFTEVPALYPNDATLAAYSPIRQDATAFAGVPLLFLASPADSVVVKSKNTDAMRAKIGDATRTVLVTASGNHGDPSEFQAEACLSWFQTASA